MLVRRNAAPALLLLPLFFACGSPQGGNDSGSNRDGGRLPDGGTSSDGGSCINPPAPQTIDCGDGGCRGIAIVGDAYAPSGTSGEFRGYADPALSDDPEDPNLIWVAYSWPSRVLIPLDGGPPPVVDAGVDGGTDGGVAVFDAGYLVYAQMAVHLGRSDDKGLSFTYVRTIQASPQVTDPEGGGEVGRSNSEAYSLAYRAGASVFLADGGAYRTADGGTATSAWYGAHVRYFQRPVDGDNPKYASSWTVRVGAAPLPQSLGDAQALAAEVPLGVTATAAQYGATTMLDQLASLSATDCAVAHHPSLLIDGSTLYLLVECLGLNGNAFNRASMSAQLFATTPDGAPRSWTWRYVGKLADATLATDLGAEAVGQFTLTRATDGTLLLVATPARLDATAFRGTAPQGCVAIELASIDPPVMRRDCDGKPVVRARIDARGGPGSCAHHAKSLTGLMPHTQQTTAPFALLRTGLSP